MMCVQPCGCCGLCLVMLGGRLCAGINEMYLGSSTSPAWLYDWQRRNTAAIRAVVQR